MTTAPTCTRCGESIGPADRFCPRCGADVSGVQASIATAVVHQHAPPAPAALQAAQLDAVRQATLGEYEILGELGRGGMATVYLAHDIALDRQVAIKVMAPALLAGEGMAERFKREARTAASLSHPNIIPIYAVRETEQTLYFVMKLIEGRPLDSIIHEIGPLPIPMVQPLVHQGGSALGYAQKRGGVHRDVKAANVMVDSDGWAVVTDFGIAKVAEAHGLTVTGATVGTPSYMSPEQCGAKDLTGASDQYSLGVVAYEMLTGRLPFTAVSVMAIMYAHFHQPPPPITNVRPDVPADLAAAVMRMLEKEPEQRWPNMEAAVAAVGGAPLAPGDPIHVQLVTLASAGRSAQLRRRISTPLSPTPIGRGVGKTTNVAALSIKPGDVTIAVGGAVQLTVTAERRSGSTQAGHGATWASTHPEVVTVSSSGLATAVSAGVATLTATIENTSATASVTVTPAGARRRRAAAVVAGLVLVGAAGTLIWVKPWARNETAPPAGPTRLAAESAQVAQGPALIPPPATPESTARRPPAGKQPLVPRRNPWPAPPQRATIANTSAVVLAPPRDMTPTVAPPVTPPAAQKPAPAAVEAVPPAPPPPPPPRPRPPLHAAIVAYARALEAQDINAVKPVAPGVSAPSVPNPRAVV